MKLPPTLIELLTKKQNMIYRPSRMEWNATSMEFIEELEQIVNNNRVALETVTSPTLVEDRFFTREPYSHYKNLGIYSWKFSVKKYPADLYAVAYLQFNIDLVVVLTLAPFQTYQWKQYVTRDIGQNVYIFGKRDNITHLRAVYVPLPEEEKEEDL